MCADGSPRAKSIDFPDGQSQTAYQYPSNNAKQFNAEEVPYLVLPGNRGNLEFSRDLELSKYDLAVVIYRGTVAPAFVGEVGPWFRLGEASICLHEHLPVPSPWTSPQKVRIRNASVPGDVLYFVFCGTGRTIMENVKPENWNETVQERAQDLFNRFTRGHVSPLLAAASVKREAAPDRVAQGDLRPDVVR